MEKRVFEWWFEKGIPGVLMRGGEWRELSGWVGIWDSEVL